jgi:uncharacterized membrane protein
VELAFLPFSISVGLLYYRHVSRRRKASIWWSSFLVFFYAAYCELYIRADVLIERSMENRKFNLSSRIHMREH